MSASYDLAVIGAGPAGIQAAISACEAGARTVLIDPFPQAGGQFYKSLPAAYKAVRKTAIEKEGDLLIERLGKLPITQLYNAVTWGIFKEENQEGFQVTLYGKDSPRQVHARMLVLANGAFDTPLAFPGWTLPGVITSGAALILLKNQRVAPFQRALVTGTGPLLLSAAAHLIEAGVEVVNVCEANRIKPKAISHVPTLIREWQRLREAAKYFSVLYRARTAYKMGWTIVEARGKQQVEEAVIAKIDDKEVPVPGTEQTLSVDTVVCGYGLTPNTSLARMIGCRLEYHPEKGGWVPWRDKTLQTSVAGIYMAGDCSGIVGAENALLEGHIAGCAAVCESGYISKQKMDGVLEQIKVSLNQQRRFGQVLGELFPPKSGLNSLAHDDTILCRCEDINMGEVRAAVAAGARTIGEVKMITRSGMGNCQGKMCERSVAEAIVRELGVERTSPESVGMYSIRPPLHPLPIEFFANADMEG
jgi:NADPH-dependent 2,4-dienoyl-CoA reductase/sulfur reductase-like enzyme/bacterioferritin-associated ferredoxin